MYTSILILAVLILTPDGTALKPDLPFRTYSQICVAEGKRVRMHDLSNEGKEVLCKVDYRSAPHQNPDVKVETEIAEAFAGNLGQDWSVIQKDSRYTKHYSITKEDALATYSDLGVKTPYNGADKLEVTKFTQWDIKPIEEDEL